MKNLKRVSFALMLALGSTFAMTSCGGGEDAAKALEGLGEDLKDAAEAAEVEAEVEVETEEVEMTCEEGKCGDAMDDSTATCGDGEAVEETAVEETTEH